MIEITVRLTSGAAARTLAELLRTAASEQADVGQARHWRGVARQLDCMVRPPRPLHRVQRPQRPDIDDAAVRRVVDGISPLPVLTRDEARLACWHLTQRGHSAAEIADRVRVVPRTVARWRAEAK
ncbi:hypothetical protein [Streptomyces seoulensis]|uniref:hypothetical protein n=1 Tax=Streptomyces seoulensis TaxID=73044 RepID=UPI001FCBE9C2|nr:hypothetical protein [Streptomyces seoulensis]BDH04866.1 hypothetical protein HEK131_20930 [Streptomyces seoulensis]